MLFDLRGRGRRRTIQIIYLFLAILMGGGLILFGIGGNTSGGILDALKPGQGGGGGTSTYEKRIATIEKRVALHPKDATAWAELTRLRFQKASIAGRDQTTGEFSADGKSQLRTAATAWDRYLALEPKKADDTLAIQMVQAFGPAGLGQLDKAVRAMEIVTEARPTAALFTQLAVLAYAAGQTRKGELAGQRALEKATKDNRAEIKAQLDLAKSQGALSSSGASG